MNLLFTKNKEEKKAFPIKAKFVKHRIALILTIVFGGFLLWAALMPIAKGVVVSGVLVVDSLRKTIQHLEGGVIKNIYIREGDKVKAEDILIKLEDTKARSERDMIRSRYLMKFAELNRLKALSEGKTDFSFDDKLIKYDKQVHISELLSLQKNLFNVLIKEHKGRKIIAQHRVEQLQEKKKGLLAYLETVKRQLSILEKESGRLESLSEKKLVDSGVVAERLQMLSEQRGELAKITAEILETETAVSEAKMSVLQIEREWQQELSEQLPETQERFIELQSQLEAAEDVLKRTVIKTPLAGAVIGLKVTTIGGVITPGASITDIVPQDEKLVIEAKVSPLDIDSIKEGMTAEIRFSSFRAKTTPKLNGIVESVSADAFYEQATHNSYYLSRLKINEAEIAKTSEIQLVPGMPAEVFINAGDRTLLQYLFDPISSVFRKGMRED